MTADAPPVVGNPYVGPTSFRLGDDLYGRDQEREDLADLLVAERIVLFYSPSGAGKTSLIQAALVPALRDDGFEVLPIIRVTHALEPKPGLPAPRNRYVMGVLLSLEEEVPPERQRPVTELATLTLREYLQAHGGDQDGRPGNEVLVFDQFEEVLTADPTDEAAKHEFFRELGEALRDRGHWALFSIREDFLAALDPYLNHLPTRLRTTFRLDLLSVDEALEAMRRPAEAAGVHFAEEAARRLVDDLRTVRVQRPGGVTEVLGSYVEPVQLQVACHLLWSILAPGATQITSGDVEALGRVDRALGDYYAECVRMAAERTGVPERVIRDWFEERLITPQGLRSQVLQGPEPATEAGHRLLGELLDAHLVRAETRRQATWYELAHDRLIEPVRRDNATWRAQHLSSVERAAVLWEQEGKPDRLLLLGADLAAAEQDEAVRTGALTPRQQEFLTASRRAEEQLWKERRTAVRTRRLTVAFGVAGLVCLVLAATTGVFLVRSMEATEQAQRQEVVQGLWLDAQRYLTWDTDLGVALAAEAAEQSGIEHPDPVTRALLHQVAMAVSPVTVVLDAPGEAPPSWADFSADGRTVVTAGPEEIQVWDSGTGELREELALAEGDVVTAVEVDSDGTTVVAALDDGTLLTWDEGEQSPAREEPPAQAEPGWSSPYIALSPDGTRVASATREGRVAVRDLEGDVRVDLPASPYAPLAFSPDGRLLATLSDVSEATSDAMPQQQVVLWDVNSGVEAGRLPLPGWASLVQFGSDGQRLATVTQEYMIGREALTVWDLGTGQVALSPTLPPDGSYVSAVSSDLSRFLTSNSQGEMRVFDAATSALVGSASGFGESPIGAFFDPSDRSRLLLLQDGGDPMVVRPQMRSHEDTGQMVAATVAGDRVFTAWDDGVLRVSDVEGHLVTEPAAIPTAAGGQLTGLDVDAAGRRAVVVTVSGAVHLWDVDDAAGVLTLDQGGRQFADAALTPDGSAVVTGDMEGRVTLWDAYSGQEIRGLTEPRYEGVYSLDVSADGSKVVLELFDTGLVLPLTGDGEPVELTLPPLDAAEPPAEPSETVPTDDYVMAVALSEDGATAVLGTVFGRIATFDTVTGENSWTVTAHEGEVLDVAIAPGGQVLSTGTDHWAALLDRSDGHLIGKVLSNSDLRATALASDADGLALFTTDGATGTVPLDDDALIDRIQEVARDLSPEECERYHLVADC